MKYKTRDWQFEGFEYDPYGHKPDWWLKLVKEGKAYEYAETDKLPAHAWFKDKRSEHKAFIGDWIVRDQFGRRDVFSQRNFAQRSKINETN